ncbi:MAG: AAA family ATPase [Lewinellaceae bacterium]|nr:AAA family ATPase [Lewinellaceae bacterium]
MIRRIEVKNYRSLKYIDQSLNNFHVLVGPNASGKTTFMDVVSFMADIVKSGIDEAITTRSANYSDLTYSSKGGDIELAIEVSLPIEVLDALENRFDRTRFEIRIGLSQDTKEHVIKEERVLLLNTKLIHDQEDIKDNQRTLFPTFIVEPISILNKKYAGKSGTSYQLVIRKKPEGNDNFYDETYKSSGKGWLPSFKLGPKRSALANLPADETKFPAATWLKGFLFDGVQLFILDSLSIREASPPGQVKKFKPDGSNLPWVINDLKKNEKQFKKWIAHVQTALPDIIEIDTIEREDDKHRYLRVLYEGNIRVPSWLVSDGTLRLLALTLPAYLPDFTGVYLIEEPENGIHPKAVETVFQSLSSVYNAQIMLASHSPVVLSLVDRKEVLCFAKTKEGITDVVKGSEHPALRNWKGETNLSILYASGILG